MNKLNKNSILTQFKYNDKSIEYKIHKKKIDFNSIILSSSDQFNSNSEQSNQSKRIILLKSIFCLYILRPLSHYYILLIIINTSHTINRDINVIFVYRIIRKNDMYQLKLSDKIHQKIKAHSIKILFKQSQFFHIFIVYSIYFV